MSDHGFDVHFATVVNGDGAVIRQFPTQDNGFVRLSLTLTTSGPETTVIGDMMGQYIPAMVSSYMADSCAPLAFASVCPFGFKLESGDTVYDLAIAVEPLKVDYTAGVLAATFVHDTGHLVMALHELLNGLQCGVNLARLRGLPTDDAHIMESMQTMMMTNPFGDTDDSDIRIGQFL